MNTNGLPVVASPTSVDNDYDYNQEYDDEDNDDDYDSQDGGFTGQLE